MDEVYFNGPMPTFHPHSSDTIMIGCGDNQVLRSIDAGLSWSHRRVEAEAGWKAKYESELQFVYHIAYFPQKPAVVYASAGPQNNKVNFSRGELLKNNLGGAGDETSWNTLAGGPSNLKLLPDGEIQSFVFDPKDTSCVNCKKGIFAGERDQGIFYTKANSGGSISQDFVKLTDPELDAKIDNGITGGHHNYSRLVFDPFDSTGNTMFVARHWPAGGVFRIVLHDDRSGLTSGGGIASVDEIITSRHDSSGVTRSFHPDQTADVINLLITPDYVFAGVTCGRGIDQTSAINGLKNYVGGLVRWDKTLNPAIIDYDWIIGGPESPDSLKSIAIGGLAQDPLEPNTIFAVTYRFNLKNDRTNGSLQLYQGEDNYKVMGIWRSMNNGQNFSLLDYSQTEHEWPDAVSMAFFPHMPDSILMATHGNGIWIGERYTGPPLKTVVAPDTTAKNESLPKRFALHANYPNPFTLKGSGADFGTIIRYDVPRAAQVSVTVYDVLGRHVRTLIDKTVKAGYRQIEWDGRNDKGATVSSGLYFYRLNSTAFTRVRKMTFFR